MLAVVSMTRAMTPTYDLSTAIKHAERAVEFSREHFGARRSALATLAGNLYLAGDFARARSVSEEAMARPEATETSTRTHPGARGAFAYRIVGRSDQLRRGGSAARDRLARQAGLRRRGQRDSLTMRWAIRCC